MKLKDVGVFVAFVLGSELLGSAGTIFTAPAIPTWYATLAKPVLWPPNWVFGPVWTTLFFLMGTAAFLVWRQGMKRPEVRRALGLFGVQFFLNVLWNALFFGLHNPALGLIEIVVLWFAILATMIAFAKVSRVAAALLVPYLFWVSFATYLNAAVWILN